MGKATSGFGGWDVSFACGVDEVAFEEEHGVLAGWGDVAVLEAEFYVAGLEFNVLGVEDALDCVEGGGAGEGRAEELRHAHGVERGIAGLEADCCLEGGEVGETEESPVCVLDGDGAAFGGVGC